MDAKLALRRSLRDQPTRWGAAVFLAKATMLRWKRALAEPPGRRPRRLARQPLSPDFHLLAESRSPLYAQISAAEWALQAGKVQNLRLAARALDGLVVPAGEVFSFWANVGRATRRRGFVNGRELREGCVIPNIGGGLCQLSNALHDVALQAGLEIVERHAHTRQVSDSRFAGRDATVFWNYVDLRFRAKEDTRIAAELSADELIVRLASATGLPSAREIAPGCATGLRAAESCETCGRADCFRHAEAVSLPRTHGDAWVVDAWMPEHDGWMCAHRQPADHLLLPMDGRRLGLRAYRWLSEGFAAVHQAPFTVLRRSITSRRLASQGATRQRALLAMDEAMAIALARRIPPLAPHLTISQNLLPFLWRDGWLGGRTFDVLMTRLPLHEMEARLDRAALARPESPTLADFRAPAEIVEWERRALAAARAWVTPHAAIATLAGSRARPVDWEMPAVSIARRGTEIVFPVSTLARKGACELREALLALELPLRLVGPVIEGEDFWRDVRLSHSEGDWLDGAAAVVLPAWIEHQPRRLLRALAAGVPVIASEACGLTPRPGLTIVPTGDVEALRIALEAIAEPTRRSRCAR
ncbi:MAG TPA: VanW family protein [Chthoniobacterales bacterium]|jgi:hypothetical protein